MPSMMRRSVVMLASMAAPGRMAREDLTCELAVVGGGSAGLAAAIEAAKVGVAVSLFDENKKPGGQLFKQIHKFFGSKDFEEVPESKTLAPDIGKIKHTVCKAYKIEEPKLYVSKRGYFNEPRNVTIYLVRYLRNDTLRTIGKQFNIEKYSTVSSIEEKEKYEMKVDKGLKKRVQNLAARIINSQRQACSIYK